MVRTVDCDSRRRAVLAATINKYIHAATPIASDDIAGDFDLSSATIRNILAELEEGGYLKHPYTSAGRVPTDKGYRYYVDFLISQMELLSEEKESILQEYKSHIRRLEDVLEKTSEVISKVSRYTGIVSFLGWQDKLFYKGISQVLEQPEFQDLSKMRELIKIIENRQYLLDIINRNFNEKVKVYIGQELGYQEMQDCSVVVSTYNIKKRPSGKIAVLGPMRMEYNYIIPTLEYISEVLTEAIDSI